MKKQNNIRNYALLIVIGFAASMSACKKEDAKKVQQQRIDQVISQQYIDTLKHLGITINDGTAPPNVEGIYQIAPAVIKASNIAAAEVGTSYGAMKIKLFSQSSSDFSIQLYGKNFLGINDTSVITAISGSGNNFTIYGKVKAYNIGGTNSAIFALIISAQKEGTSFKNLEFGLINIDNTNGGGFFIQQGKARLFYDSDLTSEAVTVFKQAAQNTTIKTKTAAMP
ncbi:MAG: hypothetical protein U0U67_06200 [Chitinophagales bacterium]